MKKMNNPILCYYANFSDGIQMARISNLQDFNFEKVVFPGERLLFEAASDAQLEIYISQTGQESLLEKISCDRLQVREEVRQPNLAAL
jgi:phosphosulfolactate synthase (CoM biosynthesis protein A)